jgi:hypothetical protein
MTLVRGNDLYEIAQRPASTMGKFGGPNSGIQGDLQAWN